MNINLSPIYTSSTSLEINNLLFAPLLATNEFGPNNPYSLYRDSDVETPDSLDDFLFVTLTPASDLVFGGFGKYQVIFGRQGFDTLYGFDHSLSTIQTSINIDVFSGASEPVEFFFYLDLLNTIGGNPPADGPDRFVLGDWNKSYYTNKGYYDFAYLVDFNRNQDIIQLHGTPDQYEMVNVPFLGTAIFKKTSQSQFFWENELVGVVFWNFDLNPTSSYFRYVGNTPPVEPIQPQIQQFGTIGLDISSATTVDVWGNVYVTGITNSALTGTNAGSYDVWVAKYNSDGSQLWINQFGSSKFDLSAGIVTDKFGNYYLVGSTQGNLAGTIQGEEQDAWVAKYDSNGNQLWIRQLGTSILNGASNITIDENDNIYVSGLTVTPDPRPIAIINAQDDFWVTKYDSNGNQQWFTKVATPESYPAIWDEAYDVAVAKDGSVYATGWTYGGLAQDNANLGFYDAWITKFNNQGQVEWIKQFGSDFHDFSWSVDVDSQGNVYAYGWTGGDLAQTSLGQKDLWLIKYSSDGTQQWVRQFGTSNDDGAVFGGIEIDADDRLFITGFTNGNFGGTNTGSYDAFVASFDTQGNQIWVKQFGSFELDYATSLSIDNFNNIYVTGFTEGSLGAINVGAVDTWVAKLDANSGSLQNFNPSVSPNYNKISGSAKKDNLIGTLSNDEISGLDGDDTLEGKQGDDLLLGNQGKDVLVGGLGNDNLIGGDDKDTLTGGAGADRFVFNTGRAFASKDLDTDTITDFKSIERDKIVLSKSTFTALKSSVGEGFNRITDFAVVSGNADARFSTALIVYDSSQGRLYYNQNGSASGFGQGDLFATFTNNPTLSAADFRIIA